MGPVGSSGSVRLPGQCNRPFVTHDRLYGGCRYHTPQAIGDQYEISTLKDMAPALKQLHDRLITPELFQNETQERGNQHVILNIKLVS
jgi:hypothetical protein